MVFLLVRHFPFWSLWSSLGIHSWIMVEKVRSWQDFIKSNKNLLRFFYLSSILHFSHRFCVFQSKWKMRFAISEHKRAFHISWNSDDFSVNFWWFWGLNLVRLVPKTYFLVCLLPPFCTLGDHGTIQGYLGALEKRSWGPGLVFFRFCLVFGTPFS